MHPGACVAHLNLPEAGQTQIHHTLVTHLRCWGDENVVELLQLRPQLLQPAPSSLAWLARQVGEPGQIMQALGTLAAPPVQVAATLALLPQGASTAALSQALGLPDPAQLEHTLEQLRALALVWGPPQALQIPAGLRQAVAQTPLLGRVASQLLTGLANSDLRQLLDNLGLPHPPSRPAQLRLLARRYDQPRVMENLLASLPPAAREVLTKLTEHPCPRLPGRLPSTGTIPRREQATQPWLVLVALGLVLPTSNHTGAVPLQVRLHLTDGVVFPGWSYPPGWQPEPGIGSLAPNPQRLDTAAAAAAWQLVRLAEQLAAACLQQPVIGVRSGALGSKELRRLASCLQPSLPGGDDSPALPWVALLLELLVQAGLLSRVSATASAPVQWQASSHLDTWMHLPAQVQWAHLAWAWLHLRRDPGTGTTSGVLGPQPPTGEGGALQRRREVLGCLLEHPAPRDVVQLEHRLRWQWPLRYSGEVQPSLQRVVEQAERLGLLCATKPSSFGRQLIEAAYAPATMPDAPGPHDGDQQARAGSVLGRLTVLHRQQAAGRQEKALQAAAQLLEPWLPPLSDHVIIQSDLTALCTGRLPSGAAATLAALAHVESTSVATFYRFTPARIEQALREGMTAEHLHTFLQQLSRTPVPQPLTYLIDDLQRLQRHRQDEAAPASPAPLPDAQPSPTPVQTLPAPQEVASPSPVALRALVQAWRSAELAQGPQPDSCPQAAPAATPSATAPPLQQLAAGPLLRLLRECCHTGRHVWVGYVNADGVASTILVQPVLLQGGILQAYEATGPHTHRQHRLAVHRITAVAAVPAGGSSH